MANFVPSFRVKVRAGFLGVNSRFGLGGASSRYRYVVSTEPATFNDWAEADRVTSLPHFVIDQLGDVWTRERWLRHTGELV